MLSKAAMLVDPAALGIVVLGTMLATTARTGSGGLRAAVRVLTGLGSRGFNCDANRAALARSASVIRERGTLCADPAMPPDPSTAHLLNTVLVTGSTEAMQFTARAQRAARDLVRAQAQRVFENAGELAPVFGLVGTLFSITQLAPNAVQSSAETTMAAVATAVLSSLYGVLSAHLVYYPLAQAIERHGVREEAARAALLDWFEDEINGAHAHRPSPFGAALKGAA